MFDALSAKLQNNLTKGMTMTQEIETIIRTEDKTRICISEWDDGGAWLGLQRSGDSHLFFLDDHVGASLHCTLTRAEAQQLLAGLQAILLKKEVAA
jgi:hypothetical protein